MKNSKRSAFTNVKYSAAGKRAFLKAVADHWECTIAFYDGVLVPSLWFHYLCKDKAGKIIPKSNALLTVYSAKELAEMTFEFDPNEPSREAMQGKTWVNPWGETIGEVDYETLE